MQGHVRQRAQKVKTRGALHTLAQPAALLIAQKVTHGDAVRLIRGAVRHGFLLFANATSDGARQGNVNESAEVLVIGSDRLASAIDIVL